MTAPKDPNDGVLVEIDAMDEAEWEQDQHTPVASDTKLEELVRQTVPTPPAAHPVAPAAPKPTFARTTTRTQTAAVIPPAQSRAQSEPQWARAQTPVVTTEDLKTPPKGVVAAAASEANTSAKLKALTTTKAKSAPAPAPAKKPVVSIPAKAGRARTPTSEQTMERDPSRPSPRPGTEETIERAPSPRAQSELAVPVEAAIPSRAQSELAVPIEPSKPATPAPTPARPSPLPATTRQPTPVAASSAPRQPTPTPVVASTSPTTVAASSAPRQPTPTPVAASTPSPTPVTAASAPRQPTPAPVATSTQSPTPVAASTAQSPTSIAAPTPQSPTPVVAPSTPPTPVAASSAPRQSTPTPVAASTPQSPTPVAAASTPRAPTPVASAPTPAAPSILTAAPSVASAARAPSPPVLPPPRPAAAKPSVPSSGVPASMLDRAGSEATPLPPPPVSVAAASGPTPAPKPFPAGPAIKAKPVAPEAEPAVVAPVVIAPSVVESSGVAPAAAAPVVVAPVVESELAAVMAESPRRANLASGSSAYPDSIEREIAARRDDRPVRAEATANIRVETGIDVNDDSGSRVAEPRRRKGVPIVFIAGGAGAVLVVALVAVFAMRGGGDSSDKPKRVSTSENGAGAREHELPDTTDKRPAGEAPGTGSAMRIDDKREKVASAGSGAETAPEPTPEPAVEPEPPAPTPPVQPPAPPVTPKKTPTLGGKKVVLEYDNAAPKETPKKTPATPAKGDESASIGAARITYFNGNRKLFAGDADGAIKLYKQALAVYPGYVAGYRGLGLAYAQKGDKANALKSFRTYLSAVPGAKDAALIKKRITTLQR